MKKLFTTMVLLLALIIVGKAQQVLLSEDFNQGFPSTWYTVDADGDGHNWGNFAMVGHSGAETDSCATSQSYTSTAGALTPDNWLITPAINLTADSYPMLSFWVCAQDANYAAEHYGVYVTTSDDFQNPNNYTLLFEETLDANGGARAQGAWKQKTAVLSAYAGQTIHIAFRHFNVRDQFYINLDDVAVEEITEPTLFVSPEALQFTAGALNSDFGRKNISVNGVLLTNPVNITLPANSPFGLSTDTNATYSTSVTLTPNNGSANATIYVVFNPTTIGYYEHTISVVSEGATSHNVNVKGLALDCNQAMPIPWYEDFTTEEFPTNCWTMTSTDTADYESDGQVYPGVKHYTWYNSISSQYAAVIGDNSREQDEHLYTPVFNLSNVTGAADFEFEFRTNPGIEALINGGVRFTVNMSTDGGNTFNTVWDVANIREAFAEYWTGWSDIWPVHFDMDQYVGTNANIQFDFHYETDEDAADQIIIQNVKFINYLEPKLDVISDDTISVFTYVGHPEAIAIPVEGRNLNSAINVTTTEPFQVSIDGTSYGETATLPATGATLYARFNPTTAVVGASANIIIANNYTDTTGTYPSTIFSDTIVINGNSYDCSGVVLPIAESFESADSTVLAPNTTEYCWQAFKANTRDAQNDIVNSNNYAYTGSQSLRFSSIKYNAQQVYTQYLISPELSANNPMLVMFNYANASATKDETFCVGYSTTGNAVSDFTWEADIVNAANTDWQLYRKTDVPADVKYVAIQYKSQRKAYLYIDNFKIMEAPACMFPVELRAESTNANSANITWTAGANETSWAYVYGMYPLNVDAIIPDTATSNTITLSDLNINSHYQMAVHAICDEGYSSWSEILDFWTTTTPAEIPYTQTFEDGDADLDNWVLFNGNQPNYFTYGNVPGSTTGKALIITHDGSTNTYLTQIGDNMTSNYSTVWAYRDIQFPTTPTPGYLLTLNWKCFGEVDYDFGELFIGNATEITNFDRNENHPGFVDVNTAHYTPAGLTKLDRYENKGQMQTAAYIIPSEGNIGTVKRLYFLWTNDSLSGAETPLAVDNINITIPQFSNMSGTVTDDQTGEIIPNATIYMVSNQGFTATATTDENGQYTITDIVAGYYTITVNANGYQELNTGYALGPGDNNGVNFELTIEACGVIPTSVHYTIEEDNMILTWDAIEDGVMSQSSSEGDAESAIGAGSSYSFGAYHLFTPTDLNAYNGCSITSIGAIFAGALEYSSYKIQIWIGGTVEDGPVSTEPIYEQEVSTEEITLSSWSDITLNTPYVIDGSQNLWIGYFVTVSGASSDVFAAGVIDHGNINDNYGNVMYFNSDWSTLLDAGSTLNYNWAIRANVVAPDYHYIVLEDGTELESGIEGAEYVVSPYTPGACYQVQTICENGQISNYSACATSSAINDVESNLSFEVYPNPAHETVNVSTTMDVQKVEIMNYLGQVIFSQNATNNNFTLNVANYADGVYFIRISGNDGIATQKLIKK
jgi:hypothetical protein